MVPWHQSRALAGQLSASRDGEKQKCKIPWTSVRLCRSHSGVEQDSFSTSGEYIKVQISVRGGVLLGERQCNSDSAPAVCGWGQVGAKGVSRLPDLSRKISVFQCPE